MRIAIDATVLDRGMTGTGRYLFNILNELPNHDKINNYFLIVGKELDVDKNFYEIIYHKQNLIPYKLYSPIWFNFVLPRILKKNNVDLLFAPNVLIPLRGVKNIKTVVVVHDIIFKIYKEYYPFFYKLYLSFFLPKVLKKTNLIVTVSEHSKKDIAEAYQVPLNKINIVYNTASSKFYPLNYKSNNLPEAEKKLSLPDKYILYVGVIEKRKNITGLLNIIDRLQAKESNLKLVLVGRPGFNSNYILPEIEKRKSLVIYYKFVDDSLMSYIYHNAFAFIFPSFYEGFGIPPLEAMQTGLPVLTSNTSSLPEVVGEGGITHDPDDYEGFANDILKLENDSQFYEQMKIKALEQAKKINIKDTTQKLISIFNKLS